mgnify:CR=1 FL=1
MLPDWSEDIGKEEEVLQVDFAVLVEIEHWIPVVQDLLQGVEGEGTLLYLEHAAFGPQ